jgi:hypothetical protein
MVLFELQAGNVLYQGNLDKALECFENALMLSTRYLGGKRMTDYAYAVTTLKDFQEKAGSAGASDKDMQTAFGVLIQAGRRFYGLQNQVMAGTACALVASDFGTRLSVDGGGYADAPLALPPVQGSRAVSVQPTGAAKAIILNAVDGEKLLFVQNGFASLGKVALENIPAQNVPTIEMGSQTMAQISSPLAVKAALIIQKQALTEQKQEIQKKARWAGWLGPGGWSAAAIGTGLAGCAYLAASQALSSYNSDTTAGSITSDRNKVMSMNTLYQMGLGVGSVGLCAGILSLFLAPNTSKIDKQLKEVDRKILLLGGN